ncbi:MAG: HAD family hydrolase [Rhizobiales bacterium]|nr:HAD family hydrolase [Hyphomicrobiales bacterium]
MWSGPRNISTAMMYSFGNRPDFTCWDEPFYAFALVHHGNDHPMRDEIIAGNDSDWERLVTRCLAPTPTLHFYQKHMTHHMLRGFDRAWILKLTNAFLIRHPARVLASYAKKWSEVSLRDIGFVEQAEIFDSVAHQLGKAPAVIDADDVLADPRGILTALCAACGIAFDPAMLAWPPGPKPFDGNWARHWYNAAWASTGFARPESAAAELPPALARIAAEALPYYEKIRRYRLT